MTDTPTAAQSLSAWKKRAVHTVTLPSGMVADIRIPNLTALAKTGQLPNELLTFVAVDPGEDTRTPEEKISQMDAFDRWAVAWMCVKPTVKPEDYDAIPPSDVQMLRQFATRQIDMDAVGHQLGGLETVESFRKFRGLDDSLSDLLDA